MDIWYFKYELENVSQDMRLNATALVQFRMLAQSCRDLWRVSCTSVRGYVREDHAVDILPLYQIYLKTDATDRLVADRLDAIFQDEREAEALLRLSLGYDSSSSSS